MSSEMYEWIEKSIEEYYHLVKVLKKDDKKEIVGISFNNSFVFS